MVYTKNLLIIFVFGVFSLGAALIESTSPKVLTPENFQSFLLTNEDVDLTYVIESDKDESCKPFKPLNDHGSDIAAPGQIVYRGMGLTFSELDYILDVGIESPIIYQSHREQPEIESIIQDPRKHGASARQSLFVSTSRSYESAVGFALFNRSRTTFDTETNTHKKCNVDVSVVFRILTDSNYIDLKAFLSNRDLNVDSGQVESEAELIRIGKIDKKHILGYAVSKIDKETGERGKWNYIDLRGDLYPELPSFSPPDSTPLFQYLMSNLLEGKWLSIEEVQIFKAALKEGRLVNPLARPDINDEKQHYFKIVEDLLKDPGQLNIDVLLGYVEDYLKNNASAGVPLKAS